MQKQLGKVFFKEENIVAVSFFKSCEIQIFCIIWNHSSKNIFFNVYLCKVNIHCMIYTPQTDINQKI